MSKLSVINAPFFLIVLAIMLALGCTKADPEIVGAWDNIKAPEIVEFKADGSGAFKYANNQNPPLSFSWQHTANNNYALDVNFNGARKTLTASIIDKTLGIESTMGRELYQKHTSH